MTPADDPARMFFDLHRPGDPFVLPCAWDIASAKLLTAHGFSAIGTTSLGIAAAIGVADEGRETRAATLALVSGIRESGAAEMLTCDIEDGFSSDPREAAETVQRLDVHGINIEDSVHGQLIAPVEHAAKITAIKQTAPNVFLNARVDTYWTGQSDEAATRERIARYADAGADGIFVPGNLALTEVARITAASPLPVNVLATRRHSRSDLAEAGVARISTGSLLYRAALTAAVNTAMGIASCTPDTLDVMGYAEVQNL